MSVKWRGSGWEEVLKVVSSGNGEKKGKCSGDFEEAVFSFFSILSRLF